MTPTVDDFMIDNWFCEVAESEVVTAERLDQAKDLAREAVNQWRRKQTVGRMMATITREGNRIVPIDDIKAVFNVRFTPQTMRIIEDGIKQSLRNFFKLLMEVLGSWRAVQHRAAPLDAQTSRIVHAIEEAQLLLWDSLDGENTNSATVHRRALTAVASLWTRHAIPAIEEERNEMRDGIARVQLLHHIVVEFQRPQTGGRACPARFTTSYNRYWKRASLGFLWLRNNEHLLDNVSDKTCIWNTMAAFTCSELRARVSMEANATRLDRLLSGILTTLRAVVETPTDSFEWHRTVLWDSESQPDVNVLSSIAIQPPSYSASFCNTHRVYVSVTPPITQLERALETPPVVRFCAALHQLVSNGYLRLDILGVDYMRLLSAAEFARYERNIGKIVSDYLLPLGHLASIPFNPSWMESLAIPPKPILPPARLESLALIVEDDEVERVVNRASTSPSTGSTTLAPAADTSASAPLTQPVKPATLSLAGNGCALDHCVMTILVRLLPQQTRGDYLGNFVNTVCVSYDDISESIRHSLQLVQGLSDHALSQRVASVFKLLATAINVDCKASNLGICAYFGAPHGERRTRERHVTKKLCASWQRVTPNHRKDALCALQQTAQKVATYLAGGGDLPSGVSWNVTDRSRRRRQAREFSSLSISPK